MDPDPHGSAFIVPYWIRICNQYANPDPHLENSWIRIRIENAAGSGSAKNECGSTALLEASKVIPSPRIDGPGPSHFINW